MFEVLHVIINIESGETIYMIDFVRLYNSIENTLSETLQEAASHGIDPKKFCFDVDKRDRLFLYSNTRKR